MKRLSLLAIAILWLLNGCGGNRTTVEPERVTVLPAPSGEQIAEEADDNDEPLAENLNKQRLEELYSKGAVPGLDEGLDQELKKWELQRKFDMPIHVNKQVRNYIAYFSTERKQIFSRYLARSTRYLPMIKKVFAEYGLPEDLAYLAMIESGFNNKAVSPAAACGMWQFIKGTAVRYGLAVDSYIDERRDPEKSTRAAAEYLLDLYKRFGSWYLAAASYNCGENRVQREIDRNTSMNNYWKLSENFCLPTETKNYVPQMIAATIIAKSPEKYGFTGIAYQQPLKYELVKVTDVTPLSAAAIAVATNTEEMQALNPELTKGTTPPSYSAYLLKVPTGKKEAFAANIVMARGQAPVERYASRTDYADSSEEAQESRSSSSSRYSRRSEGRYRSEKRSVKTAAVYQGTGRSSEKANLCYKVKKGDSLSKIAKRYQTTEANLMAVNNMGSRQVNRDQVLLVSSRSRTSETGSGSPKQAAAKARQATVPENEPLEASMFPSWQKKPKPTTAAIAKVGKTSKAQSSNNGKKKGRTSETKKKNTEAKEKKGKEVSKNNVNAKKQKMLAGNKRKKVSCCILKAAPQSISKMMA